jgi:hypothetical protein
MQQRSSGDDEAVDLVKTCHGMNACQLHNNNYPENESLSIGVQYKRTL